MTANKISRHLLLNAMAAASLLLAAVPVWATEREGYSYLTYVGSDVSLVSRGEDDTTARVNMPILPEDRMETGSSSRAEAVLADGTVVRIDVRSRLRFDRLARTYESEDERNLLYLERGAVSVESRYGTSRDRALRIDTEEATILFPDTGLVRIDAGRRGTEIYVQSGKADISTRTGRVVLRSGEYAFVDASGETDVEDASLPRDRFTRFIEERRDRSRRGGGTRYVASDYSYDYDVGGFDDYGSWTYVSSYGRYCWRPRVAADWRPYSLGYWRWAPAGLTWVSYEPWGWLPYHYGTWSFDAIFGWCWLPGVHYSPAWVHWNYTPTYIGWCPVGYYGYYDNYYRSTRVHRGWERGSIHYIHLAGRVDVSRIDHRGWNYVPVNRIGARFNPESDVVRGDRVRFRSGEVGVISTAPLRVERGSNEPISTVLQSAVRRVPVSSGREALPVNENVTSILRREGRLSGAAEVELNRSAVRAGADTSYRSAPPEAISTGRRFEPSLESGRGARPESRSEPYPEGNRRGENEVMAPRGGSSSQTRPESRSGDWRTESRTETQVERRAEPRTESRPEPQTESRGPETRPEARPERRSEGWRDSAPGTAASEGAPRRRETDSTIAPPSRESRETREAAPPRTDDGWRSPSSQPTRRDETRGESTRQRDESSARDGWRSEAPRERRSEAPREVAPREPSQREAPRAVPRESRAEPQRAPEVQRREAAPRESPRDAPRAEPRREAPSAPPASAPRAEPRAASPSESRREEPR